MPDFANSLTAADTLQLVDSGSGKDDNRLSKKLLSESRKDSLQVNPLFLSFPCAAEQAHRRSFQKQRH